MTDAQATLDDYRRGLLERARDTGEQRSQEADLEGFDEGRAIALELLEKGPVTADDARRRMRRGSTTVLGAVFGSLRREGLIVVDGYTTSTSPSRHGSLVRRWRKPTWIGVGPAP